MEQLNQIWGQILAFINQLVSPDWGALIALLPLAMVGLIGLYLVWLLVRWANVGPKRRGKHRLPPRPPAGVHAAETSWSPIFAAIGLFLLFYGIVFQGPFLVAGVTVLFLALLYWLREGMRDYDHVDHPTTALVPVVDHTPPPGVHVPGPSFRPILVGLSFAALFYGLVFGPWLIAAGVVMVAIALLQWLRDARREYRSVLVADVTGHLPPDPRPGYPRATLAAFAALFIGAIVMQAGLLPPKSAVGGSTGGTASAAPGGSPGPSGGSGAPGGSGQPSGPAAAATIVAANVAFEKTPANAPAGKVFDIAFENRDAGIPHNVDIQGATGASLFKGELVTGVNTAIYHVPPLQPGSYIFICDVHPTMTGMIVVN